MPIWTTMMARVMFSSCIRWQYIFMVLMPTFGSSESNIPNMIWPVMNIQNTSNIHQYFVIENRAMASRLSIKYPFPY